MGCVACLHCVCIGWFAGSVHLNCAYTPSSQLQKDASPTSIPCPPCPPLPAGTLPWRTEREAALGPATTLGSDGMPGSQLGATSQLGGASQLATSLAASQLPVTPQEGGSQAKELSKEAVLQVRKACILLVCRVRLLAGRWPTCVGRSGALSLSLCEAACC